MRKRFPLGITFGFTAITRQHYSILYFIIFASNSLKNHLDPENIYFLSISILFAPLIHNKVYELEIKL
jgi:hypothetical protein